MTAPDYSAYYEPIPSPKGAPPELVEKLFLNFAGRHATVFLAPFAWPPNRYHRNRGFRIFVDDIDARLSASVQAEMQDNCERQAVHLMREWLAKEAPYLDFDRVDWGTLVALACQSRFSVPSARAKRLAPKKMKARTRTTPEPKFQPARRTTSRQRHPQLEID